MPEDNFIPYQVKFDKMNTLQLIYKDYSYNLHYPTNFPNYKTPPVNFVKEKNLNTGNEVIEKKPMKLTKKWNEGNFKIEEDIEFSRLDNFEFDKYCYTHNISQYEDNSRFFKNAQDILKKLIPKTKT